MYKTLLTLDYKGEVDTSGNAMLVKALSADFEVSENEDFTFLRPQRIVDSKEHPYFEEYKPSGDVLFKNTEFSGSSNNMIY